MATILIQNENWVYDDGGIGYPSGFYGYYVPQTEITDLTIDNNYISSDNPNGYIIEAGDEGAAGTNNYFDDAVVTNNYIKWNGTLATGIITHGLFLGYQLDVQFKYNYLDNVPMGIIRKSNGMTDTAGVVAYNIIVNGAPGVVCKGMNGVRIYNNTFYSNHTSATCNRAMIEMYYNDSIGTSATSENCKVKNNIFYSVSDTIRFISIDSYSTTGFECDYNVYWCENSVNHEPRFTYHGSSYTWTQWRALGYDAHSVIVNPNFHKTVNVLDAHRPYYAFIPERRLNYGINLGLGSLVSHGLDYEDTWSTATTDGIPKTQIQDSNWQVGAFVLRTGNDIGGDWYLAPWGSDTLGDGSFNNPYFTLNKLWTVISAGDTCYMRGGDYEYTSIQYLYGKNGTSDSYISIFNYTNETPNITKGTGYVNPAVWPHGLIRITGSYIHFRGIEVSYFEQESSGGIWNGIVGYLCHNSIFENLNCHHNGNGMGLVSSGDNQIINSDFHHNYDPYDTAHPYPDPGYDPYGDADGLGIQDDGYGTETIVIGCRFWCNSDDGIDLWYSSKKVTIENCWSFWNGYSDNGVTPYDDPLTVGYDGDGNGFKLGPCVAPPYTGHELEHLRTINNCVSVFNRSGGFNMNVGYCIMKLNNNISYSNGLAGYYLFDWGTAINEFNNNITLSDGGTSYLKTTDILHNNSFLYTGATNTSYSVSTADFVSVSSIGLDSRRQYNGNLPILNFLHLVTGSDLKYTGYSVSGLTTDCDGKDWNSTPSLGAFEYVEQLSAYYVAPFGSNTTGTGTFSNPYATLKYAWDQRAAAGVTIYMRGGVYEIDTYTILGVVNGTSGNTIKVYNFPGEQPTIMPSSVWLASTNTNGLYLRADYTHIKGLEICGFVQRKYASYDDWEGTTSFQLYDSDYCTLENLHCHHGGFGIGLSGNTKGTGNLVLNCDVHDCYDPYTLGYEYGGTDGITIRIDLTPGTTNTVRGCRMWNCSDDGFDGWGNEGLLIWDSCWSFKNGYREDGVTIGGDGNGIKFGPIRTLWESDQHEYNQHLRTMQNCVAAFNRSWGFHENATCCIRWLYNNIAYNNLNGGFCFNNNYIINPIDIARNNISYGIRDYFFFNSSSVVDHNTKNYNNTTNTSYSVSDLDFVSLDSSLLETERQSDGSLPIITALHLAEGSDLINTGTYVGLSTDGDGQPWHSTTPSLGAFEYPDYIVRPTVTTTAASSITTTTASSGGNITDDGGSSVTARGICWSTNTSPTLSDDYTTDGSGDGVFISSITGLMPDTTYYIRAYATNAEGTAYGNELSFETAVIITTPTVTTTAMSNIQQTTAISGGNVLSDGNASVTVKGVCWNTIGTPTIADDLTTDGAGTGSYISSLTGLTDETHYYLRAYATNSEGTAYGSEIEFDTLADTAPTTLTTDIVANWKLNEGSLILYDSVGTFHFNGSSNYPLYMQSGKLGYCIDFSYPGYNNTVSTGTYYADLVPSGETFTLSYWVNFKDFHSGEDYNQQLIYWRNTGTPKYMISCYYRGSSNKLNFYFKTNDGGYCETQATGPFDADTWYHVVCVANGIGQLGNMYVNTVKYNSHTIQNDIPLQADSNLMFGAYNEVIYVSPTDAKIDDVCLWHRALTESEVIELYNEGEGLIYPFDGSEESFVYLNTPVILKFGIT